MGSFSVNPYIAAKNILHFLSKKIFCSAKGVKEPRRDYMFWQEHATINPFVLVYRSTPHQAIPTPYYSSNTAVIHAITAVIHCITAVIRRITAVTHHTTAEIHRITAVRRRITAVIHRITAVIHCYSRNTLCYSSNTPYYSSNTPYYSSNAPYYSSEHNVSPLSCRAAIELRNPFRIAPTLTGIKYLEFVWSHFYNGKRVKNDRLRRGCLSG